MLACFTFTAASYPADNLHILFCMKVFLCLAAAAAVIALVFVAVLFTVFPLKYKNHITEAAALYNVDPRLIAAVINAESGFRADAVSHKGAVGLMQVMPATAEWVAGELNIRFDTETLKNPQTNILIGTFYLKHLLDKFADEKTALIAYNAGEGNVREWLADSRYAAKATSETAGAHTETRTVLVTCPYPVTNKYVEKVLNGKNFYRARF